MTSKRAVALAIAGAALAILVFAAVLGEGDDPDRSPGDSRGKEAGRAPGTGAANTKRGAARGTATGRGAGTSAPGAAGEKAAGSPRAGTALPEEPHWNVYLVGAGGGPPRRLTDTGSEAPENPDWSPVGTRIVI